MEITKHPKGYTIELSMTEVETNPNGIYGLTVFSQSDIDHIARYATPQKQFADFSKFQLEEEKKLVCPYWDDGYECTSPGNPQYGGFCAGCWTKLDDKARYNALNPQRFQDGPKPDLRIERRVNWLMTVVIAGLCWLIINGLLNILPWLMNHLGKN